MKKILIKPVNLKRNLKRKKRKKRNFTFTFFCHKKFVNNLMYSGKKQLIEKIIYRVFFQLKQNYKIRGVLFLYEIIQQLNPYVTLFPYRRGPHVKYVPRRISIKKQYHAAVYQLCKSIKEKKLIIKNVLYQDLIMEELINFVFESDSSSIVRRDANFMLIKENITFFHYRW
jgi:ribosomal protein S7